MVKGRTGTRTLRCGAVALLTVLAAPAAVAGTNAMSGAGTVGDCGGESVTAYRQYRLENTATGVRVARGGNTLWNLEIDNPEGRPFFHPLSLKRGRDARARLQAGDPCGQVRKGDACPASRGTDGQRAVGLGWVDNKKKQI